MTWGSSNDSAFFSHPRLPFDPEQLEIPDEDKTSDFPQQPQGYINNDPRQNNPLVAASGPNKGQKSAKLRIEPSSGSSQGMTSF
jgi:hypothetical protein